MIVLVLLVCGLLIWNGLLTYIMLNHLRKHEVFTALWEPEQERLRYEGE